MRPAAAVRIGVAAALCLAAASAAAQTDAPGMPGLLGRSPHQDLEMTISASDAYDDNLVALINETNPDPAVPIGGAYQGLSTRLQYRRKFRYATFVAGENSLARYYPSLTDSMVVQHSGVAAFTFTRRQTTIALSQSALTSPFYSYATLPALAEPQAGDLPARTADQSAALHRSDTYTSTASISQGLGQRIVVGLSGTYQNSVFEHEPTELQTAAGAGRLSFRLMEGLSLVGGYGYQQGMYTVNAIPSTVTVRTYNLGVDFSRTLTTSHRTSFAFHTGTAAVADSDRQSVYQIVGDARVGHQISRSWRASASYTRGVSLINGIQTPTLSNGVSAGLDGALSRRLSVSALGGYSRDQIGVTTTENLGKTYSGSGSVRMALSRLVSMSASYIVYRYRFDQDTSLPLGIPPRFERQELRLGVDVWLPLVR